jgi:demethylmenaquinone methyltransferase/2-methoxy-6-polyprenyl-1,4-benzoquinol methylase
VSDPRPGAPHPILPDYYRDEAGRRRFLTDIFDRVATRYDLINGWMGFGSGRWYRRWALGRAGVRRGARVLDVAAGTGEVTRAALDLVGPSGFVTGIDPSSGMLARARAKVSAPLTRGVAEALPFRDGSFDFVTMGYALRHVVDLKATFTEYLRVLRPGGTVVILDFARPPSRIGLTVARVYLNGVLPWSARLLSGGREAQLLMHYCWDTLQNLVAPATILAAMTEAGFTRATGCARYGVLSEYVARKPETSTQP